MITPTAPAADRAAQMREQFDATFAHAPLPPADATEDLLAIRVGQSPYALRLGQVSGLFADKRVTAVPGATGGLLGIAGFRGSVVTVYDLRALLGESGRGPCRWMVLAASDPSIGLAFDELESYLRVPAGAIAAEKVAGPATAPRRETVRVTGGERLVVPIPTLLDTIDASRATTDKER